MATATKAKGKKGSKAPTVRVTLSTFDSSNRPVYRTLREKFDLANFIPITAEDYSPNGMTPLLDATVEFVEHLRSLRSDDEVNVGLLLDESGSMAVNRGAVIESANKFVDGLRQVKSVDPNTAGKGFLVVATDGEENASHKHGYEQVRKVIAECEGDGWVTVFLGASIDGWAQGAAMGLSGGATGQTVSTVNTPQGTRSAMANVSSDSVMYLEDVSTYQAQRATTGRRSVTEDGSELTSNISEPNIPVPPAPTPRTTQASGSDAYDPSEALTKVTGALEQEQE